MSLIFNLQKFSTHDGPGLRTTLFFKGCNMKCFWCHNPESFSFKREICYHDNLCLNCGKCAQVCPQGCHSFKTMGHVFDRKNCTECLECTKNCINHSLEVIGKDFNPDTLLREILADKIFYETSDGGVTFSGGEALCQLEHCLTLATELKKNAIHLTIETNGNHDYAVYEKINPYTDLYLYDIKDTKDERHQKNTMISNQRILENIHKLDADQKKTVICALMINTINCEKSHYDALIELYFSLKNCLGIKIIPYHEYGDSKNIKLGNQSKSQDKYLLTKDEILKIKDYFIQSKVPMIDF